MNLIQRIEWRLFKELRRLRLKNRTPSIIASNCVGTFIYYDMKLRYLSPTILFVTILSLINSFKVFREVFLLTGKYPYDGLYMLQHFMNNTFVNLDYQKLSAAAVVMGIVMTIIIAILFIIEGRFGKDVEG